jgi:DNA-directed RNA polymerase subunit beta'
MKKYRALKLYDENEEDLDAKMQQILEIKKKERENAETLREEVIQSVQEGSEGEGDDFSEDGDE